MEEGEWLTTRDPFALLDFIIESASDRKLRLFACYLYKTYQREFQDERLRAAVEMALRAADDEAGEPERAAAFTAAREAVIEFEGGDHLWEHSAFAIPAYTVGDREQLERTPSLVLEEFDCNFYTNPRVAVCLGLRDIFGNPFRPVTIDPAWLTSTVAALATSVYDERAFDRLPILADALQDAGCDDEHVLAHLRGPGPHARGCWVVDLVLGKS